MSHGGVSEPEIYVKVHYCIVCKKTEVCQEETCDFRETMNSHGNCYGELTKSQQRELDQVVEKGLSADDKESERKAKRTCYMKEYRRQWKELNPKYHNDYRERNPDTMKTIRKKYTSSDKGKAVRKKYADKTKSKRSEYQKNYMKEYRAKKKAEKNKYTVSPPFTTSSLFSPNRSPRSQSLNLQSTVHNNPQFNPQQMRAIMLARKVRQAQSLDLKNTTQTTAKLMNDPLTKDQKIQLLTTRIREIETLLELGTEGTQGVVSLQKQLMKLKTALRRIRR